MIIQVDWERFDTDGKKQVFPRRRELYEQGLNDVEISMELDVTEYAIKEWRRSRNLPPNSPSKGSPGINEYHKEREQGYCFWCGSVLPENAHHNQWYCSILCHGYAIGERRHSDG